MCFQAMTFNLRMNNPADGDNAWPYRDGQVIKMIKDHDPDIFGVQEGLHIMVLTLQDSLPGYTMIGEGRGGGEIDEYNAIFYKKDKFQMIDNGQFWLSETPEIANSISWNSACPRICTWGEFTFKNNPSQKFVFFNTHLDHVSQEAREKGIRLICSKVSPHLDLDIPVILTGDLNVDPTNEVITLLQEIGLSQVSTEGRTFHDFKGGRSGQPIDYIFISKHVKVLDAIVDRRLIDEKYPSDHYPVVAKLDI